MTLYVSSPSQSLLKRQRFSRESVEAESEESGEWGDLYVFVFFPPAGIFPSGWSAGVPNFLKILSFSIFVFPVT
jgi:hypothetical protein